MSGDENGGDEGFDAALVEKATAQQAWALFGWLWSVVGWMMAAVFAFLWVTARGEVTRLEALVNARNRDDFEKQIGIEREECTGYGERKLVCEGRAPARPDGLVPVRYSCADNSCQIECGH